MSNTNEILECVVCSQILSMTTNDCPHCLLKFCTKCLIKHQEINIKDEFMNLIRQIDDILAKFLYHAHNQTEWTNHLTEDRKRLEIYIDLIHTYNSNFPVHLLPNSKWISHVKDLISKYSFAIHENCVQLLYPSVKL